MRGEGVRGGEQGQLHQSFSCNIGYLDCMLLCRRNDCCSAAAGGLGVTSSLSGSRGRTPPPPPPSPPSLQPASRTSSSPSSGTPSAFSPGTYFWNTSDQLFGQGRRGNIRFAEVRLVQVNQHDWIFIMLSADLLHYWCDGVEPGGDTAAAGLHTEEERGGRGGGGRRAARGKTEDDGQIYPVGPMQASAVPRTADS